ncbi:hypothetical protein DFH28DRAFT_1118452 [Melampsora americana]|nr:hypothetical protein DFH28DRAFT_1118452 [Melampsora americana]
MQIWSLSFSLHFNLDPFNRPPPLPLHYHLFAPTNPISIFQLLGLQCLLGSIPLPHCVQHLHFTSSSNTIPLNQPCLWLLGFDPIAPTSLNTFTSTSIIAPLPFSRSIHFNFVVIPFSNFDY